MLLTELGQTHKRRRNNAGGVLFVQDYEESSLFAGKGIKLLKPKKHQISEGKKDVVKKHAKINFFGIVEDQNKG